MEIVVRLRPGTAQALRGGAIDAPELAGLHDVLREFGVTLKPQHPDVTDPALQSYFTISGVSSAQSDRITAALLQLGAVEAAYAQPAPHPAGSDGAGGSNTPHKPDGPGSSLD